MVDPSKEKAERHLAQSRYHQHFTLQPDPSLGISKPLEVYYSDCDYRRGSDGANHGALSDVSDGPTVVVLGGMYGGRYAVAGNTDALARKHGVRMIAYDKFGQGGTEDIGLEYRVKGTTYLIASLLQHLGVKHVALISHSVGTVYLLNVLLSMRHILHPQNPLVCFLAPWVHTSHSGTMAALKILPDSWIGGSDEVFKWVNRNINPAFAFSTGIVTSAKNLPPFGTETKQEFTSVEAEDDCPPHDKDIDYPFNESAGASYSNVVMRHVFGERTKGGADDAFLCLKRGDKVNWGLFEDYDDAIPRIVAAEADRATANPTDAQTDMDKSRTPEIGNKDVSQGQRNKLRVQARFAESDSLVGEKGKQWFDELWKKNCDSGEHVVYESATIPKSDHDSITELRFGVIDAFLAEVRRSWKS